MAADPQEILNRIKDLAFDDEEKINLKNQLNKSVRDFEGLREEMLALKRALHVSKSDNEKQKLALEYSQKSKEVSLEEIFDKGNDYRWGRKGIVLDHYMAVIYFEKAASQGHVEAQIRLASCYRAGEGVK